MAGRPTIKAAPPFGQRLAALRKERGWTQSELAQRLGTTVKMVTYYEREAQNPTHKTIETIAEVFRVSVAELIGADAPKNGRKPGPPSRLQQQIEQISQLPRARQRFVSEMLDTVLQKSGS